MIRSCEDLWSKEFEKNDVTRYFDNDIVRGKERLQSWRILGRKTYQWNDVYLREREIHCKLACEILIVKVLL